MMKYTLSEIRSKEIINIKNGAKLGFIDDLEFDAEDSRISAFIVYGRSRLFGFLGREDDLVIKFKDIEIVGVDTVLISLDDSELAKRHMVYTKKLSKTP